MTDGIFKRLGRGGFTRAMNIMSTQSTCGFEWSVKIISGDIPCFAVGIASHLELKNEAIINYDETAILYCCNGDSSWIISRGNTVHSNLPLFKTGDVIRFRFQPPIKKLIIELVRF